MNSHAIIALILFSTSLQFVEAAEHPYSAKNVTSLTNPKVRYRVPQEHYFKLQSKDVTAIIVDNDAVDLPELPDHRAGYNGIASLKHRLNGENLFVSTYAGLNFEHIHDGTNENLVEKFEPRKSPMELRIIDDSTVELYQAPTGNFQLESCGRYHITEDGTIEYTFECIPRAATFSQDYIGLFWASYINAPEEKAIFFTGQPTDGGKEVLVKAVTPQHGVKAVHVPSGSDWFPDIEETFMLSLVAHRSDYVYTKPWFDGYRGGLRFRQSFESQDNIFFVQSPSGGGNGNPAWDFEWFIPDYQVDQAYGFTMQATYTNASPK